MTCLRVDVMKRIDQVAGGFGCFALDVVDLVLRPFRRPVTDPAKVRTILVTKYLGMGSIILAAPMVRVLRERYPGARVVFLTFRENREIADMLGIFDEVLTIDAKRLAGLARDTLGALLRLWRLGVDVVFDLEFFTRYSTLVAYLSGARTRVGYFSRIAWRGNLLTHPVYYNGTKHITRVFLAQAEAVGAPVSEEPVHPGRLAVDAAAAERVRALLAEGGFADRPVIVVNPNASELCLERRWMPDRFARVVDSLLTENPSAVAVFVGSPSEAPYTASVLERCRLRGRAVSLAGRMNVRELAELLRGSRLFLTNDSGPLHLASLVGTPTVSLFGPETPTLYGPVGPSQHVFYSGVYCSPCLNVYNSKTAACRGNNICLQAFAGTEVLDACRRLLRENVPVAVDLPRAVAR